MAITAIITHYQRHYGVAAPLPHLLPICSTRLFQNDLARSVKILIAALRAFYLFWTLFLIKFLDQWFPTFFGSRHPYLVLKLSGGTPSGLIRYKDQGIVIIGGTPGTSSWHPSVPWHPGWEPLF